MKIDYTKSFTKQYNKLRPGEQQRFKERLALFRLNPNDGLFKNHPLQGKFKGLYSINIGGDLRALYSQEDETLVLYVFIGTHSQLYG